MKPGIYLQARFNMAKKENTNNTTENYIYIRGCPHNPGMLYITRDIEQVKRDNEALGYKDEASAYDALTEKHFHSLLALGEGVIYPDWATTHEAQTAEGVPVKLPSFLLGRNKAEVKKIKAIRKRNRTLRRLEDIDRKGGPRALRKLQLENARKQGLTNLEDYKRLAVLEDEAADLRKEVAAQEAVIDAPLDPELEKQEAVLSDLTEETP
jgi:hypothetical protein